MLLKLRDDRSSCGGEKSCPRSEKCAKGRGHSGWCNVEARRAASPIAYDADEDDMPLHSDGSATE